MPVPWKESHGYDHNVVSHGDGMYRCTKCDKMATAEDRFSKTVCNTDPDRCEGQYGRSE